MKTTTSADYEEAKALAKCEKKITRKMFLMFRCILEEIQQTYGIYINLKNKLFGNGFI